MKLASYYADGLRIGAVVDDMVWDLRRAYEVYLLESEGDPNAAANASTRVPSDMAQFIQLNHGRLEPLDRAVRSLADDPDRRDWALRERLASPLSAVRVFPPILRPSKIVNIGNSYHEHIVNSAKAKGVPAEVPPKVKVSFFKAPSTLLADGDPISYPDGSSRWDWEGELAIVMGRTCKGVEQYDALDYVFGYLVFNDACVRDVPQVIGGNVSPRGKSADGMAPVGPWIVTADTPGLDPNDLRIRSWVNDDVRQDARTSQLIWPIQEIISEVAGFMSLLPGDLIATGSPAGIAVETGAYLTEGDRVRVEIEGIGTVENVVSSSPAAQMENVA
jgi:2-keto-4-pentenoate hydratase/2-oxohepta-3-ene-1,7-dioic acid hydratase in catechol pathway